MSVHFPMKRHNRTQLRLLATSILRSAPEPISLPNLHELIRRTHPKSAFSTIYRIARDLEATNQIVRVDWRERGSAYEWADKPHHHHITCSVCGALRDIDDASITFDQGAIERQTKYQVGTHHFELEGICPSCQLAH